MGNEENQVRKNHIARKLRVAAIAAATLLSQNSAPAGSPLQGLLDTAKHHAAIVSSSTVAANSLPPLVLKPSDVRQLRGSGHSSHASHASHYSSSSGGGGGSSTSDGSGTGSSGSGNQKSRDGGSGGNGSNQGGGSGTTADHKDGPTTAPSANPYSIVVYMKDKRRIDCKSVQDEGDNYALAKRAGTIRVLKSDVDHIENVGGGSTTQPSSPAA